MILSVGDKAVSNEQCGCQDQAWNDSCGEKASDRGLHQGAVKDEYDAWRNDWAYYRGSNGNRSGVTVSVSLLSHGRDQCIGQCSRIRHGRARHTGEKDAGHNIDMTQAAFEAADHRHGKIDQNPRNAQPVHDLSGHNKEGHGH